MRMASPRASVIGLLVSSLMILARASTSPSILSAARLRAAMRACAGSLAMTRAASVAAVRAFSMSSASARGTVSMTRPSKDRRTSSCGLFSPHQFPLISIFIALLRCVNFFVGAAGE